ncbi:sugar phosphate isomerase/epimerase [Streptomyces prunicolor]|nr:sugar phosphate isomerase/epimerase [Streptomyces prunicolor]MCX5240400.1 sugar phosphate isomerase/epimerase [Streptomyces prunicolor]
MTEVFIASALTPERIAAPSTGAGFDPARLATVTEQLALACEVITAEGLRPCLHPHVGSWIETETETRAALDGIDPSLLSFGPDTGHLHWAGIDPAAIIRDYRDRVGAVHLKDVHSAVAQEARAAGADYRETTVGRHVWTEPGRGDIDLEAALHALPEAFSGWLVVEVDIPDQVTREESAERSGAWVRERLARSAESQEEKV